MLFWAPEAAVRVIEISISGNLEYSTGENLIHIISCNFRMILSVLSTSSVTKYNVNIIVKCFVVGSSEIQILVLKLLGYKIDICVVVLEQFHNPTQYS